MCVLIFKRAEAGGDSHLLAAGAVQNTELINGLLLSPFDCFTCISHLERLQNASVFSNGLPENSLSSFYSE